MLATEKRIAEHCIDIYVGYLQSLSHDAGWHGDSTLGRLIDYEGDIPRGSGFDQSNLKSIIEIQYLRKAHAELPVIARAMQRIRRDDPNAYTAMIADRVYRGRQRREGEDVVHYTPQRLSLTMGITIKELNTRAERGRRKLVRLVGKDVKPPKKAG